MVRLLILPLLSVFSFIFQIQASTLRDSMETQRFKKLATQMRLKSPELKEGEYEVRIWNNWALHYGEAHMLYVLNKFPKTLVVSKYVIESNKKGFRYAIQLKPTVPVTMDLWEKLLQQDLLTLPDQVAIEHQLHPPQSKDSTWTAVESDGSISVHAKKPGEGSVWISDGEGYYFELFTLDGYRCYSYGNPRSYLVSKPKISELQKVVAILDNLTVLFRSQK